MAAIFSMSRNRLTNGNERQHLDWLKVSRAAGRGGLILGTHKREGFSLSHPVLAPNTEKGTSLLITGWGFQTQGKAGCSVQVVEVMRGSS